METDLPSSLTHSPGWLHEVHVATNSCGYAKSTTSSGSLDEVGQVDTNSAGGLAMILSALPQETSHATSQTRDPRSKHPVHGITQEYEYTSKLRLEQHVSLSLTSLFISLIADVQLSSIPDPESLASRAANLEEYSYTSSSRIIHRSPLQISTMPWSMPASWWSPTLPTWLTCPWMSRLPVEYWKITVPAWRCCEDVLLQPYSG